MGNIVPSVTGAEHIGPQQTGDNIEAKRVANYVWNGSSWERNSADATYATRIDDSADPITYIGKATIGSATSSAVWQIAKLDTSSGLSKTWAGSAGFTQVWDDRAGLSYS